MKLILVYDEGVNSGSEGENCANYAMISVDKVRRFKTNNRYNIKWIPLEK